MFSARAAPTEEGEEPMEEEEDFDDEYDNCELFHSSMSYFNERLLFSERVLFLHVSQSHPFQCSFLLSSGFYSSLYQVRYFILLSH